MSRLHYTPKMLECSVCHQIKPETEFYRQSYTGIPLQQCKECVAIKRRVERGKQRLNKFISKEKHRTCGEVPDYSLDDWRAAMLHFRGCCAYCGKPEGRSKKDKFDRDHLIPISRLGKTVRNNVIPACPTCNRSRGNSDWQLWFRKQPFWTKAREDAIIAWYKQEV